MGADTRERIQRELQKVEEERFSYEKMRKEILSEEEDMRMRDREMEEDNRKLEMKWRHDGRMRMLIEGQKDILYQMQKERVKFLEDEIHGMDAVRRQLADREEECYARMRFLEQEESRAKEEK